MDNPVRLIMEQVASGRMKKEDGLALLKTLKRQEPGQGKEIAIIGMSVKLPGANDIDELWERLTGREDAIRPLPPDRQRDSRPFVQAFTALRAEDAAYSHGGYLDEVDRFDYGLFQLSPKEAALMDPNQRLFLEAAWEAIEDAGYGGRRIEGTRTGVYLGYADWPVYGQYISKHQPADIGTASIGNTPSIMASRISYLLDLQGPAFLVDTACSSSLVAIHLACMAIRGGECDMAIAGGVKLCLMPVDGVFEIGIESAARVTRTFDDRADGTVWSEGTAVYLLKPLDRALRDGDAIHAVIKGSAMNNDGASAGITAPNAAAQERLLTQAWKDADVDPATIAYVEAHGTGTRLGDPIEADGLTRAFRRYTDRRQFCAIGSAKSNIGHLDAASGAAGMAKAIAALKYKAIPPTLHFSMPNRNIAFESSPLYVSDKLEPWASEGPRRCGVSSFGFSGTNCHLVLEEAPAPPAGELLEAADEAELLALSARGPIALQALIGRYVSDLPSNPATLRQLCYTANTGRGRHGTRLSIVARGKDELRAKLKKLLEQGVTSYPEEGIYYGDRSGRLARQRIGDTPAPDVAASRDPSLSAAVGEDPSTDRNKQRDDACDQAARQFVQGIEPEWDLLYGSEAIRKARVPRYPFQRSRCWLASAPETAETHAGPTSNSKMADTLPTSASVVLTGRDDGAYTDAERLLAGIWADLLGHETLHLDDDFFDLGGNSILAIRLEVEAERRGKPLPTDALNENRTLRRAAAHIAADETLIAVKPSDEQRVLSEPEGIGPSTVVIAGIEPFNDLYYRSCLYNSMFPAVRKFGGSILPFLLNDLILYRLAETVDWHRLEVDYESVQPLAGVLRDMGLAAEPYSDGANLIDTLRRHIGQGHPVVVWVDSYYESIRKDAYLKQHIDHTLLVYGYDEEQELFHIVEHDRRENLSYRARTLPYSELAAAAEGFADRYLFNGEHQVTHYVMRRTKEAGSELGQPSAARAEAEQLIDLTRSRFALNQLMHQGKLAESMKSLRRYAACFRHLVTDEEKLKPALADLVQQLNDIILAKQVEHYRLSHAFNPEDPLAALAWTVQQQWDTVRKGLVRYLYLPVYQSEAMRQLADRVDAACQAETQLRDLLLARLETCLIETTV
ncbi:beta-ketoacyl synthase N-terminal-like domain-containing protein [Paenibacillus methanolicus]|uniref:Butirosin biosynthesis protein H-like n=1 Tax=Paenibacillus methanolicus TaxID=582686 RepID=A0A5S5BYY4_9BACL|nr:beta-ketoacyl synthase N-terminal-like domain-containing protein [Paenibacillus methanolicus]TYP72395.1 butirosin biosynthesis protein H-like [Paenibacillus methanolicus]